MSDTESSAVTPTPDTCAQCGRALSAHDRVHTGDRAFCRSCYATLRAELEHAVAHMSADINYVNATVGALLGGATGALAWWGFTVLTHIAFGLIAVAIGFLVGWGTVRFAGGKRSAGLQALAVTVSLASYIVAMYLVNMSFVNQAMAKQGEAFRVAFPPQNFDVFAKVVMLNAGLMDAVFLAIVLYQAWKIPKSIALPPEHA